MTKAELILHNAEKLRSMHDEIHSLLKFRSDGDAQREQWSDACRIFHESYDQLAFPGGLSQWMSKLDANDPAAIEDAISFLEADPLFFGSGYIKESALKQLRRHPLTSHQKKRLQQVILARARDLKPRREFRRYCSLAPFVSDSEFQQAIIKLAGPSGTKPKHAQWVLERLKQGIPKQKK